MTFSGGNSSRHRRRRMAMEVAGHRGRGNELSRRATARLRPPEPDEPLPVEYTEQTAAAAQLLELEPPTNGVAKAETANGSAPADPSHSDFMVETFNGNGLTLELEPVAEMDGDEPHQANVSDGFSSAETPEAPAKQADGQAPGPAEEAADSQPVRFKWDPKTGQAIPVT